MLTAAMVKTISYPLNLLRDIGVSAPDTVNTARVEVAVNRALEDRPIREFDILMLIYRDKRTLAAIGNKYNISSECIRQLRSRIIRLFDEPHRKLLVKVAVLSSDADISGEYIWNYAVLHDSCSIKRSSVIQVMKYLQSVGVVFPDGEMGELLAGMLNPSLAKLKASLQGVHASSLVGIENIGFTDSTSRILRRFGLVSLRDLLLTTGYDLSLFQGLGVKRMQDIKDTFSRLGIKAEHLTKRSNRISPYSYFEGNFPNDNASFCCFTSQQKAVYMKNRVFCG